jgi:hypothetical protein
VSSTHALSAACAPAVMSVINKAAIVIFPFIVPSPSLVAIN